MENSLIKCPVPTNAEPRWPYRQYYVGDKDQEQRRSGLGENHWSGAESLEWYIGKFVRDTMHGEGDYRWRYKGSEGAFVTYEGYLYGNRMHGYGTFSYPDGKVFNGLYYNNIRWGPGVETNTNLQENVGLWRGNQLVRLAWRPKAPSVTLDFNFGPASIQTAVESHRILLTTNTRNVGEVNSAIELLKQNGAEPIRASEKWTKLYPKHCNDLESRVCHVELFKHEYYKKQIIGLEEVDSMPFNDEDTADENSTHETYYAWNNNDMIVSMMKHCYKHEKQRRRSGVDLPNMLTGLRTNFKYVGKHEYNCRNLIMSSYLGYIHKVAQLINQDNVHPDIADMLGNTAIMYAVCGNQAEIIHFLVEAGGNVNSFNDSCCTPLSLALLKFACLSKDVPPNAMVQSLSPPPQPFSLPLQVRPSEWHITRALPSPNDMNPLSKTDSKNKLITAQKSKGSSTNMAADKKRTNTEENPKRKRTLTSGTIDVLFKPQERNVIPEEKIYNEINSEFLQQVTDLFFILGKANTGSIPYLFEVTDMTIDLNGGKEDHKNQDKNKSQANVKNTRPSKDFMWHSPEREGSMTSADKAKSEMLEKTMSTIVQLLSDGADPRLVRCPQSALWIAVASGSADLVRRLVQKGANINEIYPEAYNYSILDMTISKPLTYHNLSLIRAILECGGTADHRLKMPDAEVPGPTLLHAVLAKHVENIMEEEICCQILELLLDYDANPLDQFEGASAMDRAMFKSFKFLDIFVKSPKTDLNAIINDSNQTVLVKMFSLDFYKHDPIDERLQMLTNLLLYGADPLLKCQNLDENYENIFVFAKQNMDDMKSSKYPVHLGSKTESKIVKKQSIIPEKEKAGKGKPEKGKKEEKPAKPALGDIEDYKQALNLVRDCVRILHIRWIQANLMKELLEVVEKYEHRQWNMILPEHKSKRPCGLWLSMSRCLEIWDLLKTKRKKKVIDRRILKHALCMVQFCCNRVKTTFKWPIKAEEKGAIENDVCCILHEHKTAATMMTEPATQLSRPYVTPELAVGAKGKFQICFECGLPLPEDKIQCSFCKQVSFCSIECMRMNILEQNVGIHPCSENLRSKYFPSTSSSIQAIVQT